MAHQLEQLQIHTLTFNCARRQVDPAKLAPSVFKTLPSAIVLPDVFAISLQEVAPIAYSFLGKVCLDDYFKYILQTVEQATRLRLARLVPKEDDWAGDDARSQDGNVATHTDSSRWRVVALEHVGMTALIVLVRLEAVDMLSGVDVAGVGVGLWAMGNKGAVGARLRFHIKTNASDKTEQQALAEQQLTFIAAHLAPFEWNVKRRNLDFANIVRRLVFSGKPTEARTMRGEDDEDDPLLGQSSSSNSNSNSSSNYNKHQVSQTAFSSLYETNGPVFFFGDLNYRTSSSKPAGADVPSYPRANASPASPSHYSHLLQQDQLTQILKEQHAFHHFAEYGPISFPPTYKYLHRPSSPPKHSSNTADRYEPDEEEEEADWLWASHRWPSWCDRILYLIPPLAESCSASAPPPLASSAYLKIHNYDSLPILESSDHRPVALSASLDIPYYGKTLISPFPINSNFRAEREWARTREIVVGIGAYLVLTRKGQVMVFCLCTFLIVITR